MLDRLGQVLNILLRLATLLPAPTFNAGTDFRDVQLLNMLWKFVPAAVFSNGIVWRAVQPWNIWMKFVPAAVFSNGIVWRDVQPWNMLLKLVPATVFRSGIVWRDVQLLNMPLKLVTLAASTTASTCRSFRQFKNICEGVVTIELTMLTRSSALKLMFCVPAPGAVTANLKSLKCGPESAISKNPLT